MKKQRIKLNESQLASLIKESVKQIMFEAKVTPSRFGDEFYDDNEIDAPDFEIGEPYYTGNAYRPYAQNVNYKGKFVGGIHQGGKNFGCDYIFSVPDVEYGNQNGWGQIKYFKRADEFENYVSINWDKIRELIDSGTKFD